MIADDLKPNILRFKQVESTNWTAREAAAKGHGEGTFIIAESQTSGKGSNGKIWASPSGGLYLSALLYPKSPKKFTDLSIVAGVAVVQAIREILPKNAEVSLKWPNDVLLNGKKVAGILCEVLGEEYFKLCVIGIGVNVNLGENQLSEFLENPFSATSFKLESGGQDFRLQTLIDTVCTKLLDLYRFYHKENINHIRYLWQSNCKMIGKRIELREMGWRKGDTSESVEGEMIGIDESGGIIVADDRGKKRTYLTGHLTCCWQ